MPLTDSIVAMVLSTNDNDNTILFFAVGLT